MVSREIEHQKSSETNIKRSYMYNKCNATPYNSEIQDAMEGDSLAGAAFAVEDGVFGRVEAAADRLEGVCVGEE
jgi:hypothetical protein